MAVMTDTTAYWTLGGISAAAITVAALAAGAHHELVYRWRRRRRARSIFVDLTYQGDPWR